MKNIAILTGGDSAEYDISLLSANTVLQHLNPELFKGYIIHLKNDKFTALINKAELAINKADFTFSWRNNFIHNPTIGGHPAFNVSDIKGLINKLQQHDIPFTDAKVYAMPNIHQVYLFDPNANIIEINQNILNNLG